MSDEENVKINPCRFKSVCRNCKKVARPDRPEMCITIECEHYELCSGCGMNRTLHGDRNLCKICLRASNPDELRSIVRKEVSLRNNGTANIYGTNQSETTEIRKVTITPPGVPPPELNEEERKYYLTRWEQYEGYYRNPASYFTCHMLIIEEINVSYLNTLILKTRGEAAFEFSKERQTSMQMLKLLNEQLPEKEAQDVMDDEKSIAIIYDKYQKEKKLQSIGAISRVISPEAIALAPELPFTLDPRELLERCGFEIEAIEDAIERISSYRDKTPEQVLEFFGFKLREEYAMPYGSPHVENLEDNEELINDDSTQMET